MIHYLFRLLMIGITVLSTYTHGAVLSSQHFIDRSTAKNNGLSASMAQYTFTGASGSGIDYFQSCFSADVDCSSCVAPIVFASYSTALPYGSYNISTTALTQLLKQTQIGSGTYYIKLAVQSTAFDCASGAAYCNAYQDTSTHNLCLSVNYNGTSVTSVTQNDNGQVDVTSNPKNQYMFIVDTVQKTSLLSCPVSATGSASSCTLTPGGTPVQLGSPQDASITTINDTQYIYIIGQGFVDADGLKPSAITRCVLGSSGSLSGCLQVTKDDTGYIWLANPASISITTIGSTQYAYISDITNSTIYSWSLDASSIFNTCQNAVSTGYSFSGTVLGMSFAVSSNQLYAYVSVSQGADAGILKCTVGLNSLLSDCAATGTNSSGTAMTWDPYDIQIAYSSGPTTPTRHAYVAEHGSSSGNIYLCEINNTTGALYNCAITPASSTLSWQPLQISFSVAQNGGNAQLYAYISEDSAPSSVWQCTVQSTGQLNSCSKMRISGYALDTFSATAFGYTAPT